MARTKGCTLDGLPLYSRASDSDSVTVVRFRRQSEHVALKTEKNLALHAFASLGVWKIPRIGHPCKS